MVQYEYQENRVIPEAANPFFQFRPSGITRIVKGAFEYSFFHTLMTYSLAFQGFGLHSYFLERTGVQPSSGRWARMGLLGRSLARCSLLSVPFFYAKQVLFGLIHQATRERPKLRVLLKYCYLQNLLVTAITVPLVNLFLKNWKKSTRTGLILCAFSLFSDLFIEGKREALFMEKLSMSEVRGRKIDIGVEWLRGHMSEMELQPGMERERRRLQSVDWEGLANIVKGNEGGKFDMDKVRQEQMSAVRNELWQGFEDFKRFL